MEYHQPVQYIQTDVHIVDDEPGISTLKRQQIIETIKKQWEKNLKEAGSLFTALNISALKLCGNRRTHEPHTNILD